MRHAMRDERLWIAVFAALVLAAGFGSCVVVKDGDGGDTDADSDTGSSSWMDGPSRDSRSS